MMDEIHCQACPRLSSFLAEVKQKYPDYHARPVSAFGDERPHLLIVGLAPGMHGANRSGRPFTGDYAGILLYQTLFDLGLASAPKSMATDDGLELFGIRITNAVKCLPPQNKPETSEVIRCNGFLKREIKRLPAGCNLLALGKIAHDAVLRAFGLKLSGLKFAHGATHRLPDGRTLTDSYHCSRYNTQTKRLTESMFRTVLQQAAGL